MPLCFIGLSLVVGICLGGEDLPQHLIALFMSGHPSPSLPFFPAKAILYCELLTDRRQQPNMLQHKPVSISSDSVEVCIYVNQYVKKALIKKQEFLDICSPGVLSLWLQWRAGRGIGSKWGVNWMMVMRSRPGGGELCRTTVANFTPICSHIPAALQAATLKFKILFIQFTKSKAVVLGNILLIWFMSTSRHDPILAFMSRSGRWLKWIRTTWVFRRN